MPVQFPCLNVRRVSARHFVFHSKPMLQGFHFGIIRCIYNISFNTRKIIVMPVIKLLTQGFLLPGTIVVNWIGVSIEEDCGILRSFINSSFWGALALWIALEFYL